MIRIILMTAMMMFMAGCMDTDPNTIYLLNRRVSEMESGGRSVNSQPRVKGISTENWVTIYIPLRNGGWYPVRITQASPNVFMGPKGEMYYYNVPTVDQLKAIYGQP